MKKAVQSFLRRLAANNDSLSDDALQSYVLLLAVAVVSCIAHIFFALFFAIIKCTPLMIIHAICSIVTSCTFLLISRLRYDLAGIIIAMSIFFSSFTTIYFTGPNNFSILYQFTVLVLLLSSNFYNRKLSGLFTAGIPVFILFSYFFMQRHTAQYLLGEFDTVLAAINIFFNSVCVIIIFYLQQNVHDFVDKYRMANYRALEDQAYLDPLTKLYNRRYADMYFEDLSKSSMGTGVCFAMCDLDDFKNVNDTFGHDAGDVTLKMAADIMLECTRKSDMVCRWGGEEFLIVLKDASPDDSKNVLEKIRQLIEQSVVEHTGRTFKITMTIGASMLKKGMVDDCIKRCDKNLYYGKNNGKNKVIFT